MPRPRLYATEEERRAAAARRQGEYRERARETVSEARMLLDALRRAFDRGDCPKLLDDLPEVDVEALAEVARRLDDGRYALVNFRRGEKRHERAKRKPRGVVSDDVDGM